MGKRYHAGEKGRNRVGVFERDSGIFYLEFWEGDRRKRISTGHCNWEKAKRQADRLAAQFGEETPEEGDPTTLGTLFDKYIRERTPEKAESTQKHDRRCRELFCRFFGRDFPASELNQEHWDRFRRKRRTGAIDARGHEVPETDRTPRGARIVAKDLVLLNSVLRWGVRSGWLDSNPCQNLTSGENRKYPKEKEPRRPHLSDKRYKKMLGVASNIDWRFRLALKLANETGHRIGSIRQLRWSDVDLKERTVRWRGRNDKIGHEHTTALTGTAVRALREDRKGRPAVGEAWVFPAPRDDSKPCSRHLMRNWWLKAEQMAGIEHEKGVGWHTLRRKFANEFMHVPLKVLAGLGGWKKESTILQCYQSTDVEDQRQALRHRRDR